MPAWSWGSLQAVGAAVTAWAPVVGYLVRRRRRRRRRQHRRRR